MVAKVLDIRERACKPCGAKVDELLIDTEVPGTKPVWIFRCTRCGG